MIVQRLYSANMARTNTKHESNKTDLNSHNDATMCGPNEIFPAILFLLHSII